MLTLSDEQLMVVSKFKYLENLITTGGGVREKTTSQIAKAKVTFADLRHLKPRSNIWLPLKGRVYNPHFFNVLDLTVPP